MGKEKAGRLFAALYRRRYHMTLAAKQYIAAIARILIRELDCCDDGDFVELVLNCINDCDPVPLEVGRL